MLEDFRLKVFETVAQCGSFTKAAGRLKVSQPAVSQNISELEKVLGGALFERGRGFVTLTPKGEQFRVYVRQILHWYKAAEDVFVDGGKNVSAPVRVQVDDFTGLEIASSQGDVHIRIIKSFLDEQI